MSAHIEIDGEIYRKVDLPADCVLLVDLVQEITEKFEASRLNLFKEQLMLQSVKAQLARRIAEHKESPQDEDQADAV
jgi:hypothetical protein